MNISKAELDGKIRSVFAEVYDSNGARAELPDLGDSTVLLETGLDSLGFAILVTRLEEELGYDPFSLSAAPYYPSTYGEFLSFYAENQP